MARNSARNSARTRLDQPKDRTRSITAQYDPEMFGRWSERVARFIGSARFIGWMTAFVIAWLLWNTLAPREVRFDEFPFIFLTLMLSLQASYAAPLILLAQNRQADRDKVQYFEDRNLTERLVADAEYLTREVASVRIATGDLATRDFLRGEVRDLADEMRELLAGSADVTGAQPRPDRAAGEHRPQG
ncbi:MAG: DUF1003 domain-containing protein [Candidatus Nanopelagicales bacterium]